MSNQEPEAKDHPLPEKALKELFAQSHDRGRAGLPVMSLSMGRGLVPRNQDERRVETNLSHEEHRLVRAGELAYNMMRMWQGVCSLAEEDCLISPAYVVVRPLDGMDPKFSECLLTYEETVAQFKHRSFGVVDDRLRLYYKDFERVRVRVPSPAAQRKIAKILTTLDSLIEKSEALIAKSRAVKQGIMHDLFSRGVDEHGHLRPSHAEASNLYKSSLLGWIPKEWAVQPVRDFVTDWAVGPRFSGDLYAENGNVATLRTTDIDDEGNLNLATMPLANIRGAALQSHFLRPSDLVVSRSGTCGVTAIFQGFNLPVLPGAFLIRFRFGTDLIPDFLKRLFNSQVGRERVLLHAEGGAQKNLRGTSILSIKLSVPSVAEQRQICDLLTAHETALKCEMAYVKAVKALKSGLLQDLLSGKVRVHVDPAEEAVHA